MATTRQVDCSTRVLFGDAIATLGIVAAMSSEHNMILFIRDILYNLNPTHGRLLKDIVLPF
jgi:hypothetical protein